MMFLARLSTIIYLITWLQSPVLSWSYEDQDNWPGICTTGTSQSPIDIDTENVIVNNNLQPLNLNLYKKLFNATMINDGETIKLTLLGDFKPSFSGGSLTDEYILDSFHFHWSTEHTVDGIKYGLELHLLHVNSKYGTVTEAVQHPDGLSVISVLYEASELDGEPNIFDKIANEVPNIAHVHDVPVTIYRITLEELLPKDGLSYFTYLGSKTTPDCQEVITWFVLSNPGSISYRQLNDLTNIYSHEDVLIVSNARNTQLLNDRQVQYYQQLVDISGNI